MPFRFPIRDVKIIPTLTKKTIAPIGYQSASLNEDYRYFLNQREFSLEVRDVAWYYARDGDYIEIMTAPCADVDALELYLNGSVYGAILHQRKILPLHGSCFRVGERTIMICGESGVGKSSLTAAFCLDGADFLTDDVSPIVFKGETPHLWSMSDRIKLHEDSLRQLNQKKEGLRRVGSGWEKYYFPMQGDKGAVVPLHHLLVLAIHDRPDIVIQPIKGVEKFVTLRNEIYRKEYLWGMPENENSYAQQLILMAQAIQITKVSRPAKIPIEDLRMALEQQLFAQIY